MLFKTNISTYISAGLVAVVTAAVELLIRLFLLVITGESLRSYPH